MATMTAHPPRRHRITADEYRQMGEAGVLQPDARVELIEGELIDMPPIGTRHAATVERVVHALRHALADRAMVRTQQPSVIGEYSVPQPDVTVVVPRDDFYENAHPEPRDVLLAIEVADSTLAFDRDVKTGMYARGGVRELWIVHVTGRSVMRFAAPAEGAYAETQIVPSGETIGVGAFPDICIDTSTLFAA
jgi:Uma2 family endonuclease